MPTEAFAPESPRRARRLGWISLSRLSTCETPTRVASCGKSKGIVSRTRLTQLLVGGVAAVLVVAAIDALRSLGGSQSSPTIAVATTNPPASRTLRECTRSEMAVSIEVRQAAQTAPAGMDVLPHRRRVATVVVRRVGSEPCFGQLLPFSLKIWDGEGRIDARWRSNLWYTNFPPAAERTVSLPDVYDCDRPGPFRTIAVVGPYVARRDHLSYTDVTCWKGRETPHA
jgi:hypothetical protein